MASDSKSKSFLSGLWSELFLISLVSLFLELLVIRWLASEIRAFSIYKNFPLIACYVGLGFGFMKSNQADRWFKLFPFFLLFLIAVVSTSDWTGLSYIMMPSLSASAATSWWVSSKPPTEAVENINTYIAVSLLVFFLLISVVSLTFAGIGAQLGKLFDQYKPLDAYAINLVGAALGIFAFSVLSYIGTGPVVWIAVGALPSIFLLRKHKLSAAAMIACIAVPILVPLRGMEGPDISASQRKVMWSPYHRVDMGPAFHDDGAEKKQVGWTISVNKGYFQQPLNLSDEFIEGSKDKERLSDFRFDQYEFPYRFKKAKKVLVLGSGTGNDVAAALRQGAEQVDAVEIDPLMAKLGKQLHPESPYSSPKVRVFVDDARAYLRKTKEKYDLVLTGFLDSHTVAGNSLSVRLDDYVYTVDGMKAAMGCLKEGGVYSIAYCAPQDFLYHRLAKNLRLATQEVVGPESKPLVLVQQQSKVFHLLSPATEAMEKEVPDLVGMGYKSLTDAKVPDNIKPSTDDWPYLYLQPTKFDSVYLLVNIVVLALAWMWCGKSIRANNTYTRWQLMFLGAAFLLLELSIIDRMALTFGTVWIVNSVCIFAVLIAIILANMIIIKFPQVFKPNILYGILFLSIVIIYFMPLEIASEMGMLVGGSLAAAISVIPIFIAGLIFSGSFATESEPSNGLAFNMFGAVIGGLLEFCATFTGIRSLLLIALVLYAISLGFLKLSTKKSGTSIETN